MQSGMGAWRELTKYNSGQKSDSQHLKEAIFLSTWSEGEVFCSTSKGVQWNVVPHRDFLPRDLANRFRQFRSGLSQPRLSVSSQGGSPTPSHFSHDHIPHDVFPSLSEDRIPPTFSPCTNVVEQNADDILNRILQDLAVEVENEFQEEQTKEAQLQDLPEDLQDPAELLQQAAFWSASTSDRGSFPLQPCREIFVTSKRKA